jgi:hypothetical protein
MPSVGEPRSSLQRLTGMRRTAWIALPACWVAVLVALVQVFNGDRQSCTMTTSVGPYPQPVCPLRGHPLAEAVALVSGLIGVRVLYRTTRGTDRRPRSSDHIV